MNRKSQHSSTYHVVTPYQKSFHITILAFYEHEAGQLTSVTKLNQVRETTMIDKWKKGCHLDEA